MNPIQVRHLFSMLSLMLCFNSACARSPIKPEAIAVLREPLECEYLGGLIERDESIFADSVNYDRALSGIVQRAQAVGANRFYIHTTWRQASALRLEAALYQCP